LEYDDGNLITEQTLALLFDNRWKEIFNYLANKGINLQGQINKLDNAKILYGYV
jgi:hypothetical protein